MAKKFSHSVNTKHATFTYTYLTHSHQQAESKYRSEAAKLCQYWKQQCQRRCPRNTKQHENFATDLLRQRASKHLGCCVAVEEASKDNALSLLVPVE